MDVGNKSLAGGMGEPLHGREPAFYEVAWIRGLMWFCGVLIVVAGCTEVGTRVLRYGADEVVVEGKKMTLFVELKNRPTWLSTVIVDQIFDEAKQFAGRDQETYERLLNPLDKDVLKEVAANYTGIDAKGVNHWALRNNAWIKQVVEVKRVVDKKQQTQTIEIYAEYRTPAAWVLWNGKCYLVDRDFVRLPGEYTMADRKGMSGLMAIRGVAGERPEPGVKWSGEDLAEGMKLVEKLQREKYAAQIDAVNVSNLGGRRDSRGSWIVLDTIWAKADGTPHIVMWGRPVGGEGFYDVSVMAKMKALNWLYVQKSRIDAGQDFVDIHSDQPQVPKLATQGDDDGMGRRPLARE